MKIFYWSITIHGLAGNMTNLNHTLGVYGSQQVSEDHLVPPDVPYSEPGLHHRVDPDGRDGGVQLWLL